MAGALEDIKVLDFTHFQAGPTCTLVLRGLGAEVIKVERPGMGDMVREFFPFTDAGESAYFINLNLGKKSITLNLRSEKGLQIARDLAKKVDVIVENLKPGVMSKLGLGYEEISKINPRLVYASLAGFGQTGPRRYDAAFDIVAQAMGGFISINGLPGGPPVKAGASIADTLGGVYTAIGVLAALHYREKTGEGQLVDISMQDCVWNTIAMEHSGYFFMKNMIPLKPGNSYTNDAGTNIYQTKDDYIIISAITDGQYESLLKLMGREDLVGTTEVATSGERVKHRVENDAMVAEWTKTKSTEELTDALRGSSIPCSPIPTFDKVATDPQLLTREMIVDVEQPRSGKFKAAGSPIKMSKTPGNLKFPAPSLGEHNHEVYSGLLGYSREEISKLEADGVI